MYGVDTKRFRKVMQNKKLKTYRMKTKLFFSVIFLFMFCFVKAQVVTPQGVNYQAVVRDGSGFILANKDIDLQLSVLNSLGGVQWKEKHSVTTNAFGMVSVVLGEGTYVSGTQTVFSNIDWGADTYSLKTEVTYGGSTIDLGANPIMAVPYAFEAKHAKSADAFSGEVQYDKINIVGNSLNPPDESLFEVKNADGQTIFAVYDGGVQVYVSNSGEKGIKGGFAVTGFGNIKGEETDILMVSPDSTVVYVGANAGKGIKGGFAVTGFGNIKGQETNLLVVSPDSTRVYVGANADKGIKGGFAVTGFGNIKGEESDLLVVNADSTRIYIGTNEDKGIKGGFAVGSFRNFGKGGDGGEEYFRVTRDSTRIYLTTDTLGNVKGGFSVETQIKDEATGLTTSSEFFSVAKDTSKTTSIGYETKALGKFSTAMGYGTIAKQPFETVLGMYNDTADYYYESIKADRLLTVGVGSDENTRKNAFTILKNGNVGIGVLSPSSWEKLIRPYEATTVIESNNVIITAPDETYGAYLSVGGGISAENLYLEPSYNEIDNNWLYPVISMYGGSIDANSLTLSGYYNENSHTDVSPSLYVSGGTVTADSLSARNLTLSGSFGDATSINGGLISANSLILNSYYSGGPAATPPFIDVSGGTVKSDIFIVNDASLRVADRYYVVEGDSIDNALTNIFQSNAYGKEFNGSQYGIPAQDLIGYFPHAVREVDGVLMVDYEQLVPILWQAIIDLGIFTGYYP